MPVFDDDFNRADGAIGGSWVQGQGAGWDDEIHTFVISSNAAVGSTVDPTPGSGTSVANMVYWNEAAGPDQFIEVELNNAWPNNYFQLFTNCNAADKASNFVDFQFVDMGGGNGEITITLVNFDAAGSANNGPNVTISHSTIGLVKLRLETYADGTNRVLVEDVEELTWLDPNFTPGSFVGMGAQVASVGPTFPQVDHAGGGSLVVSTGDTRPWWPEELGDDPAFTVRRQVYGAITGGDYTRGSSDPDLLHTALRFPAGIDRPLTDFIKRSVLHVRPASHSVIALEWGWPHAHSGDALGEDWAEVALVRSSYGRPSTPNDGVTLFRRPRSYFEDPASTEVPPALLPMDIVYDPSPRLNPGPDEPALTAGRWYHYALFFRIDPVNWVRGMVDSCLLPRDFDHDERMWDSIPPYYRWVDDNLRVGDGPLRRFLNLFAFEMDQTREFVESWQLVYDVDRSPIRLLRHLGRNFGVAYEQGLGDIRYRSYMARIGHHYDTRGTRKCLAEVISDASKWECDVTTGASLSLLPDDSNFLRSTGNWVPLHPDTAETPYLDYTAVTLVLNNPSVIPPDNTSRGSMRILTTKATATSDFTITCGDGYMRMPDNSYKEITPLNAGIPIKEGENYGFSVWSKTTKEPNTVTPKILWIGPSGQPEDLVGTEEITPVPGEDTWVNYVVTGKAPLGARFLIPTITFESRLDDAAWTTSAPPIDIAGAMVYTFGSADDEEITAPNRLLTLGDPGELIGDDRESPPFEAFQLGTPEGST